MSKLTPDSTINDGADALRHDFEEFLIAHTLQGIWMVKPYGKKHIKLVLKGKRKELLEMLEDVRDRVEHASPFTRQEA